MAQVVFHTKALSLLLRTYILAGIFTVISLRMADAGTLPPIQTVFIIVMENNNWSSIKGNASAPYVNNTLLPMSSYCAQFYNPPGIHPSLPNYLWLEAGTNFGIADDKDPSSNHQNTTNHLVTLLNKAGISWKSYQEDISGTTVPLTIVNKYAPKHNPMVYFDDVTGTNNANYSYGISHIRPYTEFARDLTNNTVARYNFITPNLCNDMHDNCVPVSNGIKQGDNWLATEIPRILASAAYTNGGAIFITWDEAAGTSDGPIGMIMLSPFARGGGYYNNIHYTHSSTLRTFQEIFGVTPLIRDAANAANLSDLFSKYSVTSYSQTANTFQLKVGGVIPGKTNLIKVSTDLVNWDTVSTNVVSTNNFTFTDSSVTNNVRRFYRVVQVP
ncbi:MAG: hypothetical protein JWQ71_3454 [Pedosphaera sp.]|nr:hypothetical protein [Pedosphaera sp.]